MCWVNKEKGGGGGEENERGKEGGKRRGGEGGKERGEGLGLEIVPVIRKILLQAILTARAAGSGGGWWEGNGGEGALRRGSCECGSQGNHNS